MKFKISKSFVDGLDEGLTSYSDLFREHDFRRASAIEVSVSKAWRNVGKALDSAEKAHRENIGERTRKISGKDDVAGE